MDAGYTECCSDQGGDCVGSDPFDCYCDVFCYYLDDCCTDVDQICEPRTFYPSTKNNHHFYMINSLFHNHSEFFPGSDTAVIDGK